MLYYMNLKKIKKQLEQEKRALKKELKKFAKEKSKGDYQTVFPDLGSAQDDNALETALYSDILPVEHNLELRLQLIEKALVRIKNKTFGICTKCKKPISAKRLEIIPETDLCLKCKKNNAS